MSICKGRLQKRTILTAVILALVLLLSGLGLVREVMLSRAQHDFEVLLEENAGRYNEGRLVLSSTSNREAQSVADTIGGRLRITANGRFALVTLPDGVTLADVAENRELRQYMAEFSLDYNDFSVGTEDTDVAADGDIRANFQSNEPMYPQQTYLDYINIGDSWNVSMGKKPDGEKVTVAVIDSGIDTDHPEFTDADGNSIISMTSYDATDDKVVSTYGISVIEDEYGHGTAVAGVIASQINGSGIMGIAPEVELLVIKCDVDAAGGFKSSADIVFGIYYAIEQDVDVINMSFGSSDQSKELEKALQLAVDSGIIPVAAAGNDSTAVAHSPAALETTIGVGALAQDCWELADYSNYGGNSDILAPGTTLTTMIGGGYGTENGTSMAAPVVSAAIAIYRSRHPYATFEQVKRDLLAAGKDLGEPGEDMYFGFGALDVNAFVCEEKGTITYDYSTEDLKATTQVFVKQHTIQTVPEPERDNIVFDDWYYDKGYTRVFDYDAWYTTEFVEDVTLYAKWVNEDDEGASVYSYKTLDDGTIEITSYKGKRRYLTVPDEIDGMTVSSIGISAFADNTRLREIILPKGLTTIREFAFDGVSRLRSVTFTGDSLQSIEQRAFQNCSALRKLELPDSVVTIGMEAFVNCAALSSVEITQNSALESIGEKAFSKTALSYLYLPDGVTEFDGSVLAYCRKMRSVDIASGNAAFVVQSNMVLTADGTALVYYPAAQTGTLTVPEGVITVDDFACTASSMSQVEFSESLEQIGEQSFAEAKLTALYIPANVKVIDPGAFKNCSRMTELTFAENATLQSIDGNALSGGAFESCVQISVLELPESLVNLGERGFKGCSGIAGLVIPANVAKIGKSAFESCSGLVTVSFSENCAVSKIPQNCFGKCSKLNTVNFSDGIMTIERYAFTNDYLLHTLNFGPDSALSSVGDYSFYSCTALNQMQLPETVTSIGNYAYAFSGLTSVHVPANLTNIGDGAFGACYLLTEITADAEHTVYAAVDNVLFSKDITTVYCVPSSRIGSYTLPDTVQITAPYSFYYDKLLSEVILPEGLQEIQHDSFHSCSSLQSITIPGTVTSIGRMGFYYCHSLSNVSFGENSQLQRLGLYTFVNCGMSEITIPASVETMAQYVFSNCSGLKRITFASGSKLSYVAAYLLSGTRVEEVVFEEGSALTHLQAHAFDGAKYLKSVDFGDAALETIDNYAFYNCTNLEQITIPETVTYLGRYAFYGCAGLDRMDIPALVDYIGISAFNGTNSMKVFFVSDTLPANVQVGWDEGIAGYFLEAKEFVVTDDWEYIVTYSGSAVLARYTGSAAELTIDTVDGYPVEKIGAGCFVDHETLKAVTLSANIRDIDNYAFRNSSAIVTIPAESVLERIGNYAFSGNMTESLTLPNTVTQIGDGAFEGSSLKELDIREDSTLQSIGDRAFCGSSIESIYLPASLETVGVEAFKDAVSLTEVTIADGDTTLKLSNSAFEGSGITQITVPARVYYIGEYAFGSCPDLENILVVDDNAAYQDLDGVLLDSSGTTLIQYPGGRNGAYEVPAQISVLSYASFKNAKGLTEVTFAEGSTVKTIGWQTFSGCDGLTKITVPDAVISFDFYAFENCTSLTDVVLSEENRLTGVYEGAFYGCAALTDLNLPDTVIDIGDYAFYGCTGLTAFPLSENAQIKGIGAHAFNGCSGITEVPAFANLSDVGEYAFAHTAISEFTVGAVLNEIANNTFFGCENLMNIYCDGANEEYTAIDGALYEKGATEADGYDALVAWPYGKILYIGTGKTELTAEDTAFLKDGADIHWEIADTVTTICDKAFQDHKLLRSVVIPENITDIGKNVFWGCYGLKEVYFNAIAMNDVNANDGVFSRTGHDGSKGFVLIVGANVKRIPSDLFWGSGVREIRFAEGSVCESIGSFAFASCYKLSSVKIPESVTNLDEGAFYWCRNLKSAGSSGGGYDIEFEWKEFIPQNAFSRCDALTTVTLPDSVTRIDAGAFSGCTGLEHIQIPASVTSIGSKAFYECSGLISVTIPENVTSIGDYTFYGCVALEEINFNATETNTTAGNSGSLNVFGNVGHNGDGVTVRFGANVTKVPSGMFYALSASLAPKIVNVVFEEGSVCKSIGNDAFRGCSYLTHIEIPESVTTIGSMAFYNCTGLTSAGPIGGGYNYEFGWTNDIPSMAFAYCASLTDVTIPKTITSIGYAAFSECTSLADVTIPESVTSIGSSAFSDCTSLSTITIPEKVTSIGSSAFRDCTALEAINFNAVALDSLSSNNYVFANAGTECAGITVTFGANVTAIPAYMFYPCMTTDYTPNIVRVTFDDGSTCEQIGSYAFYNCVNLTNIMIPESVTSMGSSALSGCLNLTSAGPVGGGHSYEFGWTRSIPDYAFYNLKSLTAVELPQTVTGIGNYAFSGTLGITSIVIPESVSEIGEYTFSGCPGLTTAGPVGGGYSYEFGWTNSIPRNAFRGLESLTDAIIPEGITDIGIRAFSNCTGLTNVALPESLLSIGDQAFFYCTALNDIELPDHLISIGASAFSYCKALQSITIPVTVTSIGSQAFYNCTALTRIDFRAAAAADLTTQSNVFYAAGSGTDGITVTIGANVTTIPAYLFYSANRASNIVCISFEEGSVCERIGNYAFYRAEALEEITFTAADMNDLASYNYVFYQAGKNGSGVTVCIGRDVTKIPAYIFCPNGIVSDSPNIQSVAFEENGVCASIGEYAFKGCSGMISIAIPKHVAVVGQGAFENCTGLTTAGPCGGGYNYEFGWTESIPAYAFYSCQKLTCVVMPESVTEIGSSAFYNCSGLTELTIPEGVTKIGSSVFYKCSGLTELTIPEGVTEIAASAFYNCSGLTGITIPENVTGIGSRAFFGCTSLTEITIPESVDNIQSNAFYNCTSLEKISINAIALEDMDSFSNVFYSAGAKGDGVTVTFGKNVTKIPAYLFAGNSSQKVVNVVFEDNSMCASIGNYAFKNCINLTTITIPENVISIGDSAFDNCTALRQIDFRASAMNDLGICNNVFNMAGTEGNGITVTIGANVTKIPASLFNPYESSSTAPKIVDVVFEEGSVCERIGKYAFQHNINLTSVAIPKSLVGINGLAFYNCINLAVVQIDSPAIARLIISSGNGGYLCCYAETVLVAAEISETGSYITDNFPYQETVTCNGGQYVVYSKHAHDWGEGVVITEPVKCQIDGEAAYTCATCGLVKQEITYCHNLNHYDGQAPTCTIPGWEAYDICSDCGYTSYTEIPAMGHHYESVVTAPTCTEQGFTAHTCTACGDSYVDTYVDALGHDMGEWFLHLTPTCTADGIERRDCSRCDHYETRIIEHTGHSYSSIVTAPTCTEKGFTAHTCTACGDSYMDTYVDALGHDMGDWIIVLEAACAADGSERRDCSCCDHYETKVIPAVGHDYESVVTNPTCTEQGFVTHTCTVCGDSYEDTYVDALGHDMGEWATVTEATCTESGSERRDCSRCDHHEIRSIEAAGHSFGAWFVNRPASCTEDGENRRNCSQCSHYEIEAIPATGHNYESVATAPTCTEQGYSTYTCSVCGDSYVDTYVDALGHDMGAWVTVTEAACTENGTERRDCSRCDHHETRTIEATGHSYEAVVTAPTCTEQGYSTHTCPVCGDHYVDTYVDALGHDMGEWEPVTEATCTKEGSGRRDCSRCDHYETRTIEAIGHSYEAVVTAPTCTEQGYTTYTCANCGDSYVDTFVESLDHNMGEWITITGATCTENGSERRDCSRCDHYETRDIEAKGHSFGSWFVNRNATCIEDGDNRRNCVICDHYETEVIPATGHDYESELTDPTCTEQGFVTHTCSACGDSYVDTYVDALGHDMGEWETVTEATCTENGTERSDCSRCDHHETRTIEAAGHSYESAVTTPTCTEQGCTTHTCTVCGHSYVDTRVDALGHDMGEWTTVTAATCTEAGSERRECSRCDHYETRDIDAKGHSFGVWFVSRSATCTQDGENRRNCANCSHYETEVIPATGHDYEFGVTAPTCTEQGFTTHTCTACGDSYVDAYVDALGHALGEWTTVTAATCTEAGSERRDCSRCDHYETRDIDAKGHSFGAWFVNRSATCTEDGENRRNCDNCGHYETEVIPATEHDYESVVTAPTCTEQGFVTHTCSACADSYVDTYVDSLGHNWDDGVVTVEPTEEAVGEMTYTCERCGKTRTEIIPELEHEHRYEAVITEPTCTERGYTTHTCRCGNSYVDAYVDALGHDMGEWVIVTEVTCTEDGTECRDCSRCDHYETRTIEAVGHSFGAWFVNRSATCTEDGESRRNCANCSHYETEVIPATGHDYESVVTAPTCTEQGFTTHTCASCGDSYVDAYVNALGHDMGDWVTVKEATCTESGSECRDCSRCDHYETRAIEAAGHSYEAVVTAPTCTEQGYTTHTCTNCSDSYVDTYVDALGHDMGEWVTITEATCTESGSERRDCSRCDYYETRVIAATGHSFGVWFVNRSATCTEDGENRRNCNNCSHYETEVIPATGHDYESVVTAPTCTEQGYTTHICASCGDSYVDTYVDALGHGMGTWKTVIEVTCTTNGSERRDCSRCDHYETRTVEATGHSFGGWFVNRSATCTEDGENRRNCTNCSHYETEVIPATGHDYESVVTVPTCTEQGFTNHTCSVCGDSYVDSYTAALGHDWDEGIVTVEPTEEAVGEMTYTCERCGEIRTEVIPELDHVHSYDAAITEPTCTAKGYTTHTCRCGDSYVDTYVDALGHDMGEWVTVTQTTCTNDGSERRDCSRCDHYEIRVVNATGHSFGSWFVNLSPTCTEDGENRRNCANCSHYETEVIPTTGHDYESALTDPTCIEQGYTTHICSVCGDTYVDTYVEALGHDMGEWEIVIDTTCTEDGQELRECFRCDHYEIQIIESVGHNYEAFVTIPTCTEEGYTKYVCSVCGDSYISDYVAPAGHRHEAVVTAPTCTEQGYTTFTCHCGDRYVSDHTAALGHDMGDWETVTEATCTETGEQIRDCSRCDHAETRAIEALGHDWGEGIVTVEPTEETEGEMTYTCERCGESRTEIIPELEHEHRYEAVITEPTCTERGFTTHTCRCGESYVDSYVDVFGHDMGEWFTVTEATCTSDGMEQRECSRCEHYETQVIEATGHDYESVVNNPTCTAQGFTTHTCHCGDSYTDSYTAALGHSFAEYVSDDNATCTQDGTRTAVCDRCDATDTVIDEGSAHGHDFTEWTVILKPTETAEGLESRNCVRCGIEEIRVIARLENPFADVPSDSFYYEPVMWAVANGVTNGTSATTFGPNDQCMRAHVVTFLWRAVGSPEPTRTDNPFVDVKETDFYYKAVMWALENGITSGMDATHFGPTAYCNRAQVVTFLWRTMGSPEPEYTDNPFTDVAPGSFYEKAVLWAVENGITNGLSATAFGPNAICNRAQIVTFLYRVFVTE